MADKKQFRPLDEDLDDAAERVAAAKNIPKLTPPARPREESTPVVNATQQPTTPSHTTEAKNIDESNGSSLFFEILFFVTSPHPKPPKISTNWKYNKGNDRSEKFHL